MTEPNSEESDCSQWYGQPKKHQLKTQFTSKKDISKYPEDFYLLLKKTYEIFIQKLRDEGAIYDALDEFIDPYHLYHHYLNRKFIYKERKTRTNYKIGSYNKGDAVIVELNTGQVYDGLYISTETSKRYQILNLRDVCRFPHITHQNPLHRTCFYSREIKDIRRLTRFQSKKNRACPNLQGITYEEYMYLKERAKHPELHSLVDCRYTKIIEYFKSLDAISVIALGAHVESVRFTKISYLIIGTVRKLYVFDFITSGQRFLDMGLRDVLEDTDLQKVVYDAKVLADLFKNRYKVDLRNVHDIGVVDYCVRRSTKENLTEKDFLTYPELVDKYLNLPASSMEFANKLHFIRAHYARPCSDRMRWRIGLAIIFYLPIRRAQINHLTPHIFHLSDIYAKESLLNKSQLEVYTLLDSYKKECKAVEKRTRQNNKRFEEKNEKEREKLNKRLKLESEKDRELQKTALYRWGPIDSDNTKPTGYHSNFQVGYKLLEGDEWITVYEHPELGDPPRAICPEQITAPLNSTPKELRKLQKWAKLKKLLAEASKKAEIKKNQEKALKQGKKDKNKEIKNSKNIVYDRKRSTQDELEDYYTKNTTQYEEPKVKERPKSALQFVPLSVTKNIRAQKFKDIFEDFRKTEIESRMLGRHVEPKEKNEETNQDVYGVKFEPDVRNISRSKVQNIELESEKNPKRNFAVVNSSLSSDEIEMYSDASSLKVQKNFLKKGHKKLKILPEVKERNKNKEVKGKEDKIISEERTVKIEDFKQQKVFYTDHTTNVQEDFSCSQIEEIRSNNKFPNEDKTDDCRKTYKLNIEEATSSSSQTEENTVQESVYKPIQTFANDDKSDESSSLKTQGSLSTSLFVADSNFDTSRDSFNDSFNSSTADSTATVHSLQDIVEKNTFLLKKEEIKQCYDSFDKIMHQWKSNSSPENELMHERIRRIKRISLNLSEAEEKGEAVSKPEDQECSKEDEPAKKCQTFEANNVGNSNLHKISKKREGRNFSAKNIYMYMCLHQSTATEDFQEKLKVKYFEGEKKKFKKASRNQTKLMGNHRKLHNIIAPAQTEIAKLRWLKHKKPEVEDSFDSANEASDVSCEVLSNVSSDNESNIGKGSFSTSLQLIEGLKRRGSEIKDKETKDLEENNKENINRSKEISIKSLDFNTRDEKSTFKLSPKQCMKLEEIFRNSIKTKPGKKISLQKETSASLNKSFSSPEKEKFSLCEGSSLKHEHSSTEQEESNTGKEEQHYSSGIEHRSPEGKEQSSSYEKEEIVSAKQEQDRSAEEKQSTEEKEENRPVKKVKDSTCGKEEIVSAKKEHDSSIEVNQSTAEKEDNRSVKDEKDCSTEEEKCKYAEKEQENLREKEEMVPAMEEHNSSVERKQSAAEKEENRLVKEEKGCSANEKESIYAEKEQRNSCEKEEIVSAKEEQDNSGDKKTSSSLVQELCSSPVQETRGSPKEEKEDLNSPKLQNGVLENQETKSNQSAQKTKEANKKQVPEYEEFVFNSGDWN